VSGFSTFETAGSRGGGLSFSSNLLTISNTDPNIAQAIQTLQEGKCYFGYYNNPTLCNTGTSFTISNITQDSNNTYFTNNIGASLPSPQGPC
jgi:hypothetical protein